MKLSTRRGSERWERLMYFDVPRWIRCYDSGPDGPPDRYTVVFSQIRDGIHRYVGMSEHPFALTGFGQHGESNHNPIDRPVYGHLGKKIVFADLTTDCQWLVLRDYSDLWDLNLSTHPMTARYVPGNWGRWKEGVKPWRAPRPPKGQFDSREWMTYQDEQERLTAERLHDLLSLVAFPLLTASEIDQWEVRDRQEVVEWVACTHLAASDNPVHVPDLPAVLQPYREVSNVR